MLSSKGFGYSSSAGKETPAEETQGNVGSRRDPQIAMTPKSLANSRKRPHDTSTNLAKSEDDPIESQEQNSDEHIHSPKRSRTANWPLKSPEPVTGKHIAPSPSRRKRQGKMGKRSSKFKEGSLGDKPSKVPPGAYIGEEDAMERYANLQNESDNMDVEYDAGIETSKHSGMFRFGKAIANALNPAAVWQGINGMWKESKPPAEKIILDERQAKAIEAYADLRKSGYKGTHSTTLLPREEAGEMATAVKKESVQDSRRSSGRSSFRDSAVDVDEYKARDSMNGSLKPPSIARRSVSPLFDGSSHRKSALHLRSPSFQSLKKVRSQIQIPSTKHKEETPTSPPPVIGAADAIHTGLTRQPSKKEIAKQYKLSKKVSDLEDKLNSARRELERSMNDAPPVPDIPTRVVRKPFTPGNLPSLPSERLLMAHVTDADTLQSTPKPQPKPQPKPANILSARQTATPQQAASWRDVEPQAAIISATKEEHAAMCRAAKQSQSARKPNRRRPQSNTEHRERSPTGIQKRLPKVPSKTPTNSPQLIKDEVPPMPSMPLFDPSQINQEKIKNLRAIPSLHLPLGKSYDDLPNLRKFYPAASEAQLLNYLASLPNGKKSTDHLELTHGNRSPSPFLGRPTSVSPRRTRSGASKRREAALASPPPPLPGAKHSQVVSGDDPVKRAVRAKAANWESHGLNESPFVVGRSSEAGEIGAKDDFNWDKDVF